MGNFKHTPGPWGVWNGCNIYPNDNDRKARRHIAEVSPEGVQTEECDITHEEHRSNARLIAAAPELLDLAVITEQLGGLAPWVGDPEMKKLLLQVTATARDVIAKATQP